MMTRMCKGCKFYTRGERRVNPHTGEETVHWDCSAKEGDPCRIVDALDADGIYSDSVAAPGVANS